jgi:mRNA-degrading endonuclease RelE of RelBE toxin-antitoxin system
MAYEIKYTKAAHIARASLPPIDRFKFEELISLIGKDINDIFLKDKLLRIHSSDSDNLYSLRIGAKYRGIIKLEEKTVNVLDIVNHESLEKFFKKKQDA